MKLGACLLAIAACAAAIPCIYVPLPNYRVGVDSEGAVIVWDSKAKVEHFVRTAGFESSGPEFGFLVPTPTKPTLREVSPKAFDLITRLKADLERRRRESHRNSKGAAAEPAATAAHEVQAELVAVAGYDAAILRANDAKALGNWLRSHKYAVDARAQAWLKKYVDDGWYLTAFKVSSRSGRATLGTVDIAFGARRPMYPFREPEPDPKNPPRRHALLVAVIADEAVTAPRIGSHVYRNETYVHNWKPSFLRKLDESESATLARQLKLPPTTLAGKTATLFIGNFGERTNGRDFEFTPLNSGR